MILRSRPEKRIKVFDDLRDAVPPDFKLLCSLPPASIVLTALPEWCDKIYHRGEIIFNPYKAVCSCTHYEFSLLCYPENDARRLCNHILKYFKERFGGKEYQPARLIAESARYPGELLLAHYINETDDYWFAYRENSPWVEVFINDLHWIRYSYNIVTTRWSYGLDPKNKEKLQPVIIANFSIQKGLPL